MPGTLSSWSRSAGFVAATATIVRLCSTVYAGSRFSRATFPRHSRSSSTSAGSASASEISIGAAADRRRRPRPRLVGRIVRQQDLLRQVHAPATPARGQAGALVVDRLAPLLEGGVFHEQHTRLAQRAEKFLERAPIVGAVNGVELPEQPARAQAVASPEHRHDGLHRLDLLGQGRPEAPHETCFG